MARILRLACGAAMVGALLQMVPAQATNTINTKAQVVLHWSATASDPTQTGTSLGPDHLGAKLSLSGHGFDGTFKVTETNGATLKGWWEYGRDFKHYLHVTSGTGRYAGFRGPGTLILRTRLPVNVAGQAIALYTMTLSLHR
jgi:hypothetical protein